MRNEIFSGYGMRIFCDEIEIEEVEKIPEFYLGEFYESSNIFLAFFQFARIF